MSSVQLVHPYPYGEKWDPVLLNGLLSTTVMSSITGTEIASDTITAVNLTSSSITTDKIAANAITAIKIDANSITADHIQTDAITTTKLKAGNVTADKIAAGAVIAATIAADAIETSHLKSHCVTTDKLASEAVTTTTISAAAVTSDKIYAGAVTADKINVSYLSVIASDLGTVTAGTVTAATVQTALPGSPVNRVVMDSTGLKGYNYDLGVVTFKIPTDASAPYFSSGLIESCDIVDVDIISTSFQSSSTLPWVEIDNADGISFRENLVDSLYGTAVYGTGKYGPTQSGFIFHPSKPMLYVERERAYADIHLYNRSTNPSGAAEIGDLVTVSGVLRLCTTTGTPGTFSDLLGSSSSSFAWTSTSTTTNIFSITGSSVTTSSLIYLYTNSADTGLHRCLQIVQDNTAASNSRVIDIQSDGVGANVYGMLIQGAMTTGTVLSLETNAITTGKFIQAYDTSTLTTGNLAYLYSNSASTSARNLVSIINDNALATGTIALKIQQDAPYYSIYTNAVGAGCGLYIESAVTTGQGLYVADASSLTGGYLGYFYSNSASASARNLVNIVNDNTAATGAIPLNIQQDANGFGMNIDINGTGTSYGIQVTTNSAGGRGIGVTGSSLTTGELATLYSNSANTSARNLVSITNDNTAATGAICLYLQNDRTGGGQAIKIVDGNQAVNRVLTSDANGVGTWGTVLSASPITIFSTFGGNSSDGIATITGSDNFSNICERGHLLIHFDGADAATTYTAESGQTVTFGGTAQLDDAQKKFGATSLLLDGNSDYVTVPDDANWYFGDGDFTIDFWVKLNSTSGTQAFWIQTNAAGTLYLMFYKNVGHGLQFLSEGGTATINFNTANNTLTDTTSWHHIALVRNGSNRYIFLDGVSIAISGTGWNTVPDVASVGSIGGSGVVSNFYVNGWIDEFRISKHVARWTSNFTAPTRAYNATGGVAQFSSFTLDSGQTLTVDTNFMYLGVSDTTCHIHGTISADGYGGAGGATASAGAVGNVGQNGDWSTSANAIPNCLGGAGGSGANWDYAHGDGGGAGSNGGGYTGTGGETGPATPNSKIRRLSIGLGSGTSIINSLDIIRSGGAGGGSGGGQAGAGVGDAGGAGGGVIYIECDTLTFDGTLTADGANGASVNSGGGGGGGGVVIVRGRTLSTNSGTITVTGGTGGAGGGGRSGGNGAVGFSDVIDV